MGESNLPKIFSCRKVGQRDLRKLIEVIREEVERLRDDGVTEDELEQAKKAYLQAEKVRRSSDASLAGELVQTMFLDRTMEFAADYEQRIQNASVEAVNEALRKHLNWDRMVAAAAGDFEKKTEPQ